VRITFLMPGYNWVPSGGYRVVYEYANHLVARGHSVAVIHPRSLSHAQRPPITVRSLASSICNRISTPKIDWQPIDPRVNILFVPNSDAKHVPDADVVFATAWNTVASVVDYPESKGAKCYFIQSYEIWQGCRELVDATWRAPLRKVDIAKWLVEVGTDLGCDSLSYIPNAIDHARYRETQPIRNRPKQVSMLFSVAPVKASAIGIEALEIVRATHRDIQVVFFGIDRRPSWMPAWITYHRNPAQEFIICEIYGKSRIFVSPSRIEGSPLPPAEAAACGCPSVCTDIGGHRECVTDGQTGLLSPVNEPAALARNICFLLENESFRATLALRAQQSIAIRTWDASVEQFERFIYEARAESGQFLASVCNS
jgi:glycosyltransferase involved in cell wall biosynthesis